MRVEPYERGRLHVFAVNRPKSEIANVFEPAETGADRLQPKAELLADLTGFNGLEPAGAELIPLADLEGLGLSGYLIEGLDIPAANLEGSKRKLDALEGYALLLSSHAFQGRSFALAENASLTHIVSLTQPGTDWSSAGAIETEAARPHTGPSVSPRDARHRAQRIGGIIVAVFLLAIGAFVWVLVT